MTSAAAAPTFAAMWRSRVAQTPHAPFLVFQDAEGTVTTWTYGEFGEVVRGCRDFLVASGLGTGDAVHVALRNCPAFVALWLACALHGAWIVPVDPASTERDLASHFARIPAAFGICAIEREVPYSAAAGPAGVRYLALEESPADLRLFAGHPVAPERDASPDDRLAVMFTSGTTSQPKGVVLTQANYHHVAVVMSALANLGPEHRWYVTLPLFHANAQYYCFAPAIAAGASVAMTSAFSASGWVDAARTLEVTHASLFAAPIRMILARTPDGTEPLELEHVWFAQSLGDEHYESFARLAGVRPRQLYGMTETIAIVTFDDAEVPRHDVIGRSAAGRRVRLADPATGEDVAPGAVGMIVVAGDRGRTLFVEYLDDPATTARSFETDDTGTTWLRTGDLALDTGDGVLRFVGRADDVIKVAGENVSLTEVEAAIAQAPGVLEAAVLAKPDPVRDVVPIAYVVPRDPAEPPTTAALEEWARTHLAPASRPREWHLIDALPRTSVGKVRRFVLGSA